MLVKTSFILGLNLGLVLLMGIISAAASADVGGIQQQVLQAAEERQQHKLETTEHSSSTVSSASAQPSFEPAAQSNPVEPVEPELFLPKDRVLWSILNGVVKIQRIDGQWYLSILSNHRL